MFQDQDHMTIRMLSEDDRADVVRISQRDTSDVPDGHLLGAVIGDRLVAAISLASGQVVADPFVPSDGARSILELRAKQLKPRRRGLLPRRRRRRGALGAQPAGAGGRLL
jgi:hypothetical protein